MRWDSPFAISIGEFNGSSVVFVADGVTRVRMGWLNSSSEIVSVVSIAGTGRRGYKDGTGSMAQFG